MRRVLPVPFALFYGLVILVPVLTARAQEVHVEVVQPPMRFLTAGTGSEEQKIEPSGVEPIGDGKLLLVAEDKSESLLVVEAATGQIKQSLKLSAFDNRPKWEALARDDEGAYYVIGSHFVEDPTEAGAQKKLTDVSRLFRFHLKTDDAGGAGLVIDPESTIEWDITDALAVEGYHRDPRKNEVNIEGLTVRTLRDQTGRVTLRELVIGLREPHNPIRVYAANITVFPAPNAKLALRPLFRFHAGRREGILSQLSSIDYLPAWKGFFILTSTEDSSNRYHGNTLWFLSNEKIAAALPPQVPPGKLKLADLRLVEPQKVWVFGLDGKAEGLCVLSEEPASRGSQARRARLAIVYDNDTGKTGNPGLLQFLTVLRWPE
ncbi:MAG TPA: hypothetical protein VIE89_19780 [Candidatus Binatia bacterium]